MSGVLKWASLFLTSEVLPKNTVESAISKCGLS
jgi:hypothetical protein